MKVSAADVMLPTPTTWGRPVRKYRIQLQREVFNPRILSIVYMVPGHKRNRAKRSFVSAAIRLLNV